VVVAADGRFGRWQKGIELHKNIATCDSAGGLLSQYSNPTNTTQSMQL